jgi:hypothetical protein
MVEVTAWICGRVSAVRRTEGCQCGLLNAACCEPLAFRRTRSRVAGGCERIVRVVARFLIAPGRSAPTFMLLDRS